MEKLPLKSVRYKDRLFQPIDFQFDAHRARLITNHLVFEDIHLPEKGGFFRCNASAGHWIVMEHYRRLFSGESSPENLLGIINLLAVLFSGTCQTRNKGRLPILLPYQGKTVSSHLVPRYLNSWLERACGHVQKKDIKALWLDMVHFEVIQPFFLLNGCVAKMAWNVLRYWCRVPLAYIPRSSKGEYDQLVIQESKKIQFLYKIF